MTPALFSFTVGSAILFLITMTVLVGGVDKGGGYIRRADFPVDFVFGSGASAYQVEGAAFEDGKTTSIWDSYTHSGHNGGANADVACDHYHKYKEDVKLMADIGLEAYRFSISWPRLIPNGRGPINPKGLLFYNNLINELINHDIEPHVTLLHVDVPQALEDEYGGWLSPQIVKDFTMYADICFREFGDRVAHWTTINEANIWAIGGYDNGLMPPGHCSYPFGLIDVCTKGNSSTEPYIAFHNMLLAHSSVANLYKTRYKATQNGFIGINIYTFGFVPDSNLTEDVTATQRAYDYYIGWVANPLVNGDYPEIVKKNAGNRIPFFTPSESKQVKGSFDFFGVNYYATFKVKDNPTLLNLETRDVNADMALDIILADIGDAHPHQFPLGLYQVLHHFKEYYGNPPIFIHENGLSTTRDGDLNDTARVSYMDTHIGAVLDAIRNGSNAKGYFYWSFLDGFELLGAYDTGFGLYYVDLNDPQLTRYPKLSAHWYSDFLKGTSVM